MLIGGPYNEIPTEIIDLESEDFECQDFKDLTVRMGAVGGLGFDNKPMVCGGQWGSSCHMWENSEWKIYGPFERLFEKFVGIRSVHFLYIHGRFLKIF